MYKFNPLYPKRIFYGTIFDMKLQWVNAYRDLIDSKIKSIQVEIKSLTDDAQNDAKSSSGDKHETGLAMMHLEQERLSNKWREWMVLKEQLERIDFTKKSSKVEVGSLVKLNDSLYLIAVGLPVLKLNHEKCIGVSPKAPLVEKLLGKSVGDQLSFNNQIFIITELY